MYFIEFMRPILIILFLMLTVVSAKSQNWQQGTYTDVKGISESGLIRRTDKEPFKGEACIEFKQNPKAEPELLSASDLKSIVIGRDSFVVASAPQASDWHNELDFVLVAFDDDPDMKLYMFQGYSAARSSGIQPEIGIGGGFGFGGYGSHVGGGVGGGISIPIGGGRHGKNGKAVYYYGANTAQMKPLTEANFVDIMAEMLGDEPEIVDALHQGKYNLGNINKLLNDYYKAVEKEEKQGS